LKRATGLSAVFRTQDAKPGDVLVGTFKLGRGPNEYRLRYVIPPEPADKGAACVVCEVDAAVKASL